ncbi:MAG TPA: ATP-binding protein, partial [bacterium]|nr:ATP-binding protein [bacterium]
MKIKFTYLLLILLLIAAALIFFLIKQNSDKTIASIKSNLSLGAGKGSALNSIDEILEDIIKNVTIYQKIIVHHFHPQTLQFSKKNYDAVIDTIDFYTQFFLEKTLWAQGVWFQINPDLAERSNMFCSWYLWQDTQIVKQLNAPRELNPIEDPYYFLPIKEGKGVWSNVYIDPYIKQEMITYSAPIYSDSILLGVAGIDVTLEKLNNIIRKTTENFKLSYFFVIDNNFNIIAQSDKNADTAQIQETIQILKKSVPPSNLIRLNDCYYFELVEHGQTKLGVFSKISDHFNFIATIPYTIAYKEFYLLFYSLIFIFIFVLIAFFSAFYSRKKLSDNYKKLQEQSSILNGVIQSTNDLLYYKNSSFQFMGCNDAFLKFIKLNQNDILYKTAVEIHTAIKLTDFEKYEQSVVQENKTIEQEVSFLINDETQYYIFTFTPLKDTNQESIGVLVNGHNISHFKKAEQEILRAKQLSDESNMLKSQFLANVSHEIRTPMNAILNFSDFLLNEPLTEHQREYANAIYQSGENLLELINDLLDISKIEANRLTFESISFSMEKLIYDIIPLIRARAQEKHIDVILQMDDFKYYVIGDPTRLRQIFINLLSNAVKFTEKGQVLFSIKILCEHSDDYCIEIKVQDTGIGIPSDKLDVIFQPFLQVDGSMTRKYGGTGLGLAITKKLIEQMHGAISVKS